MPVVSNNDSSANMQRRRRAWANQTFSHVYINLADHPDFLTTNEYSEAFAHPLLIALLPSSSVAYSMQRAAQADGIDSISVNAPDHMLQNGQEIIAPATPSLGWQTDRLFKRTCWPSGPVSPREG